jgi:hypothetical protein
MPDAWRVLPDPQRRGDIQFALAKSLPYGVRLALILVLLAGGFAVQALVHLLLGAVLLFAGTLLAVVKGFSNAPERIEGPSEWRGGTREQLANILEIARKSRQWDKSAIDITCGTGCGMLLLALVAGAIVTYVLSMTGQGWLAGAWALDASVLLLPHWVTGVRRILTNDPLTIKAGLLLDMIDLWEQDRREGESVCPQMLITRGPKGEMPSDAKLVLRSEKLGDGFLGLQVQVVLNRVQGSDYPYLYCVLVARRRVGMLARREPRAPEGIVVEYQQQPGDDVDVVIIRQKTTSTSGYHTDGAACRAIFSFALDQCRRLEPAA